MAKNSNDEARKFRYYEGVCSSKDFVKEIAKVLSMGIHEANEQNEKGEEVLGQIDFGSNWDIVYPTVSKDSPYYSVVGTRDLYDQKRSGDNKVGVESLVLLDETDEKTGRRIHERELKLQEQIDQITNRVILRTTTSPNNNFVADIEDLSVSKDATEPSVTMYLEIWKPDYLANPEEYPLDAENYNLVPQLITKEMYQEARKTTASVIYDLAQLATDQHSQEHHKYLVTSQIVDEKVSAYRNTITETELFGDSNVASGDSEGVLNALAGIFGKSSLSELLTKPEPATTSYLTIPKAYLNTIKQEAKDLYNFLFNICNSRSTFTENDYDLIQNMDMQVSCALETINDKRVYNVGLLFNKQVEIFTIGNKNPETGTGYYSLRADEEYGHTSLEPLKPEIYCEGRYSALPKKYVKSSTVTTVNFSDDPDNILRFCLDRVVDDDVLYGTIVLRYSYDKQLDYTDLHSLEITDSVALENNHYCLMRIFDNPNIDFSGPEPNVVDNKGNVTATNSHTSPWSKLSWYQDFEEIMMDDIDEDVSITSITDGTLLVPLETSGLTSDTRISYWINTNNDRFSLVVMGNPALDYERDRHLISSCYCGRIDSFENSVHDVSGNFALYTSSSTTPCKTVMTSHDTQHHMDNNFANYHFKPSATIRIDQEYASNKSYDKDINGIDDSGMTVQQYNVEVYKKHSESIGGSQGLTFVREQASKNNKDEAAFEGMFIYYVTLTGNKYFNENEWPYFLICDKDGNPKMLRQDVYYMPVNNKEFIRGASDSRSNQLKIYIQQELLEDDTIYFNFGYYEEKFIIKSGITRDAFGNVIGIETIDDYGRNTSDGTTSVSMYHTRSKAFYQKHHFLFATTEEYMSKVMYGKSSYTGEYYADRIKITHGNDGPRGILSDTLVIDSSSLYPKDELVINKDFEKDEMELEETFAYFPVTAPFSPLSDGPNARYGIALKKSERENTDKYSANKKVNIGVDDLDGRMKNRKVVNNNEVLPSETMNGCAIYWHVVPGSSWMYDKNSSTRITVNDSEYTVDQYDAYNLDVTVTGYTENTEAASATNLSDEFELQRGRNKTEDFKSQIKVNYKTSQSGYEVPNSVNKVFYGYSTHAITDINSGTIIYNVLDDGTTNAGVTNLHTYSFSDNFIDIIHEINKSDIVINNKITNFTLDLYNAHPNKYLNIFFVKDSETVAGLDQSVSGTPAVYLQNVVCYISLPLHYEDWEGSENFTEDKSLFALLQYPCNITAYVTGITNRSEQGIQLPDGTLDSKYEYLYHEYNTELQIVTKRLSGTTSLQPANYGDVSIPLTMASGRLNIVADKVIDDLFISISNQS